MWRCVSRLVRDALQRSSPAAPPPPASAPGCGCGGAASGGGAAGAHTRSQPSVSNADTGKTEDEYHRSHLCDSWLNAFSWSGAVVLGWYASQMTCLRRKWEKPFNKSVIYHDFGVSAGRTQYKLDINSIRDAVYAPPPTNISNDLDGSPNSSSNAEKEFKDMLRSIENKLGIIAIDDGKIEEGFDMLQSSAQKNYAPAIFNLAVCYEKGLGVKKDEKMAMELYRSAAVQNHPSAMYNLAVFYGQGRGGLDRDTVTAKDLMRVAAAQGQKDAIMALKSFKKSNPVAEAKEISMKPSPTETFLNMIGCDETFKFKGNGTILSF